MRHKSMPRRVPRPQAILKRKEKDHSTKQKARKQKVNKSMVGKKQATAVHNPATQDTVFLIV